MKKQVWMSGFLALLVFAGMLLTTSCGDRCPSGYNSTDPNCPNYAPPYGGGYPYGGGGNYPYGGGGGYPGGYQQGRPPCYPGQPCYTNGPGGYPYYR